MQPGSDICDEIDDEPRQASIARTHQHDDQQTEQDQPQFARRPQHLRHQHYYDGAQRGAWEAAEPADYDHDQDIDGLEESEIVRIEIPRVVGIKPARKAGGKHLLLQRLTEIPLARAASSSCESAASARPKRE